METLATSPIDAIWYLRNDAHSNLDNNLSLRKFLPNFAGFVLGLALQTHTARLQNFGILVIFYCTVYKTWTVSPQLSERESNLSFVFLIFLALVFVEGPGEHTNFGSTGRPDVLLVPMVHQLTSFSELNSEHNSVVLYLGEERNAERMTTMSCG